MMDYWRDKSTMCSSDVGDPTIGLSDAVVGTYEYDYVRDDSGSGPGRKRGIDWSKFIQDELWPPVSDFGPPDLYCCCCGAGTGFLIDESEIVL